MAIGGGQMRRAIAVHARDSWPADEVIDAVTLVYLERHRRRIRLVADSGAAFLLDLARARHLADGDGLELEAGGYIRVQAAAEPVLEIAAADRPGLLRIAWHLGNRHLPLQVADERLRIRADPVIADLVTGLGGQLTPLEAPFDPEAGAYALPPHER
jgi:urease accessory protein